MKRTLRKQLFFSGLSLFGLLLFGNVANSQTTRTWDGGAGTTNWGDAANWSGDVVPTNIDPVVIGNVSVTVNVAAVGASLVYNSGGGSTARTLTIDGSNSLTIAGLTTINAPSGNADIVFDVANGTFTTGSLSITINGTQGNRRAFLRINNGAATITGDVNMAAQVSLTVSRNNIEILGTGTLNIGGNINGGTLSTSTGSTVNYNGAAQAVREVNYHHLIFSGTGGKTLPNASFAVNGNLTNNGVTVIPGSSTITFSGTGAQEINGTVVSQIFNDIVINVLCY